MDHEIEAQIAAATDAVAAAINTGATVVCVLLVASAVAMIAKPVAASALEYFNSIHRR